MYWQLTEWPSVRGGCTAWVQLWRDTPRPRAEKPGRMVGAGAAAARHSSNCEETPHLREQRRSPSKTVGGAKSRSDSNPIPTRDAQRAQTNLVHTRTQRPHRDWDRAVFGCLLRTCGSAVACRRGRGSGCSGPGHGRSPLGGGLH